MSHTTVIIASFGTKYTFIHDGDYKGSVEILRPGQEIGRGWKIDVEVLRQFVARMIRSERIAAIENSSDEEILR